MDEPEDDFDPEALAASFASYDAARAQADAETAHYQNVYLPARIKQIEDLVSAQLPDGYRVSFS